MAAVSTCMWARTGGFPVTKPSSGSSPKSRTVSLELFQCRGGQRPQDTYVQHKTHTFNTISREQGNSFHSGNYKSVYKPLCQSQQHPPPPKAFT